MKVLWIDDEHETLELIKDNALDNDIELVGFRSAEEALLQLEDYKVYDAVLLDGLFHMNKNDQGTPSNDAAFGKVASKIKSLKDRGIILPWFILSGKTNFTLNQSSMIEALSDKDYSEGRVFDKKKIEETILWEEIKKAVELIPSYKLKQEYAKAFEVCTDQYIGAVAEKQLLEILKSVNKPLETFDDELYFTQIRIILEYTFRSANKFGLLHNACIPNGKVNLSESSLFLSGKDTLHLGVKCVKSHFPKLIADAVQSIIFITGAASHTTDPDIKNNINLLEYRKIIRTPYLLYSLTFQLMDVLVWFKEYVDKHSNFDENKTKWMTIESNQMTDNLNDVIGELRQDSDGNYYVNDHILPYKRVHKVYQIGTLMKITQSIDNTKTTSKMYKKFALHFEAIK